ncbi:fumarate reductase flavo protein subunit [Dacryopinax primogenitus]|uniref:Fumarate reductase flavo protein subunit n=1 Tax=Dacryopinax primogenitus (strain DJM 731) TaxID=1858805 RepID=M5FYP6_DACPD|nr:fumarate reductase flavo protein subunit [Dacryopinax primogenitus]EJU01020.1 fumarate reductase flavo protein subunit [Dacryopinax primogenitus]
MAQPPSTLFFDCVVVGSGNAGFCAVHSAVENGCSRVLIADTCPESWAGGNSYFTAGAMRTVHGGLQDLLPLVNNVPPEMRDKIDLDPYTSANYTNDIMRLGQNRSDPALVKALVDDSRDVIGWLKEHVGVRFMLSFHRQAYAVNGRQRFWGGLHLSTEDGGKGLIEDHRRKAGEEGVEIWFDSPAIRLIVEDGAVKGVVISCAGVETPIRATGVVLASGGFEANPTLREKYLGAEWKEARVRGTPYNQGDGILLASAANAAHYGDWAGCHSTCWDAAAPRDRGDQVLSNQFTKSGYPLGLMVNADGKRFVDEGEDMRNYTYARFGRKILEQPGGIAWQVYDAKVVPLLRKEEYADEVVRKIRAETLDSLADELVQDGLLDRGAFLHTIEEYNAALENVPNPPGFNPAIKDGLSTQSEHGGLQLPKTNWAQTVDKPGFVAVKVSCGITFTFGGLRVDPKTAGVLDEQGKRVEGLFCTGEMVGGLFYSNYPGGSGLTAGAVFGRKAGREIGKSVTKEHSQSQ